MSYKIFAGATAFGATTFDASLRFEPVVLLTLVLLVLVIYVYAAGFRAVIRTDKFQLLLMLVMLLGIWLVAGSHITKIWTDHEATFGASIGKALVNPTGQGMFDFLFFFVFMNLLFWVAWWPTAMDQWQRCAATGSAKTPTDRLFGTTGLLTIVYVVLLCFSFTLLGAFIRTVVIGPDVAVAPLGHFINWLRLQGEVDPYMMLFFSMIVIGFIAAIMSTIDTFFTVISFCVASDIGLGLKSWKGLWQASEDSALVAGHLSLAKFTVLATAGVIAILVWFVGSNVLDTFAPVYVAFSFPMAFIPALVFALAGKAKPAFSKYASSSFIAGILAVPVFTSWILPNLQQALLSGTGVDQTLWYNWLYSMPVLVFLVSLVPFLFGLVAARKNL